jgi:hypothetical protein
MLSDLYLKISQKKMELVFKTDFFDEGFQYYLSNLHTQWEKFEIKFLDLCKLLETKQQKNIFIVDGPIAAGKSTLLGNILATNGLIATVQEPIEVWRSIGILDQNGDFINIWKLSNLARINKANRTYIFLFQIIALASRVLLMVKSINGADKPIIFERHPISDWLVFILFSTFIKA